MLHEDIKNGVKEAMKARDEVRLRTLRGILAAIVNELVTTKHKPDELLADDAAIAVIRRLVKQRKDSIEQFGKAGRQDLVAEESAELAILEKFLPMMMSREEIKKIAIAKKAELGALDKPKAGIFVGALMKELKGKADGADVKAVVDELLA